MFIDPGELYLAFIVDYSRLIHMVSLVGRGVKVFLGPLEGQGQVLTRCGTLQ
jgi:hypothetical protein